MYIKKLISIILCVIISVQMLSIPSFATETTASPLVKTTGYQDFPAYYRDTFHADNQVTHPDVVVMNDTWNGYKYWAVYTPNVCKTSIYENPSIVASHDGVYWVEPDTLVNPIEAQPPSTRYHNCDADMIYNPKMDAMMAYWNWADDKAGGVGAEVRLRVSYDGIHWGIPVTYDETTKNWIEPKNDSERRVLSGPQDYISVISSGARYDMLSPTFVYDSFRDTFIMWANNAGDVGYQNGQNNYMRIWYSKDGLNWGEPMRVNNFLGTDVNGRKLAPWHQDIQYVSEMKQFMAMSQCFSGSNPDGSVLHLTTSKDGVNWQQVGNIPLLSPGADGSWDDFQIYRSSFYYEPSETSYEGTVRVWYSALQENTNNKMVPDSSGNLTIRAKLQDDRIWRIGYAENSYTDMMRALLKDADYTVSPLVEGEELKISSDAADNTVFVGDKVSLNTSILPADTSDQVVRYTSKNPQVAVVDVYGVVTTLSAGTANIIGETREGLSGSIELTVAANPSKLIPQSDMTASATSVHKGTVEGPASNVLDGNIDTIWHTKYSFIRDRLPQSLTVSFGKTRTVNKYVYTPRQVGTNGTVTKYKLFAVNENGSKVLVDSGNWNMDMSDKTVSFSPISAVALELQVLEGAGGFGTAAEINVYEYDESGGIPSETKNIYGNSVKITYDDSYNTLALYRMDGENEVKLSKPSSMGYPVVNGQPVRDFEGYSCEVEQDINGIMGKGERMTITSHSTRTGLERIYVLETSDDIEGAVYTTTSYKAQDTGIDVTEFVDNVFEIYSPNDTIWSYNGGGEGPQSVYDTIQKIDLKDSKTFYRENIQDYRCASIPVADIYSADGGITVGDASATRREVRTPVNETSDSACISIKWPGRTLAASNTVAVGQSFINVHKSDYFMGLRGYADSMKHLGIKMMEPQDIADWNYDLRWESWGWEFDWTIDLIINKLDELATAGVKMITLDDGWYDNAGDWGLNSSKFPNGTADMKRLTDAIHSKGMKVILWWRPCDGGREKSTLYKEHPEYFVKNSNGSIAKLAGPGKSGSFNGSTGYALCPESEGAIASQVAFINRAMNEWGFDGFKQDYVWSMPKCYEKAHNHAYPEESTEKQPEFYRAIREAMIANNPESFNLLCNCGVPQDYYSLQYVTQIPTADPTSVDQTRRRVKAYKALMGDYFPITTDHNEIWYPSSVGTGAVLIEKRDFSGSAQAEYEKWLRIADEVQLHRGRFIGDLYSYGFDPYETYAVQKDGVMYYAFYKDGGKYRPSGSPDIELKGLNPDKIYRIVDYVNDKVVTTNLAGDNAVFNYDFSNYLLLKAVELSKPDEDPEDPEAGFISVDAMDSTLVYRGTWHDDHNSAFYNGNARYTASVGASVEFTFTGTGVRWIGQKDTNFGSAEVYIDGELKETVPLKAAMITGQKLYEILNLPNGSHTIKIVCKTETIDIDRFAYTEAS